MHSHTGAEGAWYVLSGIARFRDEKGILPDLSANEGVYIPTNEGYGFESVGNETLEILHVKARDVRITESVRVDIEPKSRCAVDESTEFRG